MPARRCIRCALAVCAAIVVLVAGVSVHPHAAGVYQHNQTDLEA
jgi:hypothetical protein